MTDWHRAPTRGYGPPMVEVTWWTFEEVQEYLGHSRPESTEVWLTRHGIRAVRHYRIQTVIAEQERPRPGPRRKS